jgi:hypothetical protein
VTLQETPPTFIDCIQVYSTGPDDCEVETCFLVLPNSSIIGSDGRELFKIEDRYNEKSWNAANEDVDSYLSAMFSIWGIPSIVAAGLVVVCMFIFVIGRFVFNKCGGKNPTGKHRIYGYTKFQKLFPSGHQLSRITHLRHLGRRGGREREREANAGEEARREGKF